MIKDKLFWVRCFKDRYMNKIRWTINKWKQQTSES